MKNTAAFFVLSFLVSGCLDFGSDIETDSPTLQQLAFCEASMHISENLSYRPIGLKIIGSGIDAAAWFCFVTDEKDVSLLFDPEFVGTDSLAQEVNLCAPLDMPYWWDAADFGQLTGGTVSLPGGKYMTVGYSPTADVLRVFIFWHET